MAPTIIFVAALFAILYYFGVMQFVVRLFAVLMHRVMRASGAESLNVAASIFMGQTEAPLTIRPYLPEMTQSELMTVMTSGMAHISGGIMAAYILFGVEAKHLLTAVIMTAPGTIMMAKMFVPETEVPKTMGTVKLDVAQTDVNVIDAAARGTSEGLHLALNVLRDADLVHRAGRARQRAARARAGLSLQQIFGWVFAPVAWSMGVPWRDAPTIGNLLGTRMVLNEFIAYSQLGPMKATLDPKSFTIATFALCGFANFGSIGIQIGGIGALAPEPPPRSGPPRAARDVRRHARQFHDRDDRRVSAVATIHEHDRCLLRVRDFVLMDYYDQVKEAADAIAARVPRYRRSPSCSDRAWATSPTARRQPCRSPYGDLPHWPASRVVGHDGRLVVGTVGAARGRGAVGPVLMSTKGTICGR